MQTRIYSELEEAIEGGKQMMHEKDKRTRDLSTFMIVVEIYSTDDGFLTVLPDTITEVLEDRAGLGDIVGYVDGRFRPIEQVRAEIQRDNEQEARDIY